MVELIPKSKVRVTLFLFIFFFISKICEASAEHFLTTLILNADKTLLNIAALKIFTLP